MEQRSTRIGLAVWAAVVIAFLWIPLALIMIYAFNRSNIQSWPIPGFTTHWFSVAWHSQEVRNAIWLSVRGQHPYRGPTAADIPVLIAFVVVNFTATVAVRRHAVAGVTGRSRFSQGEIIVLVLAFVATAVAMAGLGAAGVGFAFYPTSVLVIPGLAWAVLMAIRANWREFATAVTTLLDGRPWPATG